MLTNTGQLRQDNGCIDYDFYTLKKTKCHTIEAWKYKVSLRHNNSTLA
jgi:quinol monooxygenase YgiN